MPDNLMDRGDDALGVLDFQDAGIGCVAYDLASLCEEVRRDGGFALLPQVIARYGEQTDHAVLQQDLLRACVALSAQRHIRILGLIAQLAVQKGRKDKLSYAPRIRAHVRRILEQPGLHLLHVWFQSFEGLI